jgi:hypothetical protein
VDVRELDPRVKDGVDLEVGFRRTTVAVRRKVSGGIRNSSLGLPGLSLSLGEGRGEPDDGEQRKSGLDGSLRFPDPGGLQT